MRTALVIPYLRSNINQANVIRTAECFGVTELLLLGYPELSHLAKITRRAERHFQIRNFSSAGECVDYCFRENLKPICVENSDDAESLLSFHFPGNCALVMGHEKDGCPKEFLDFAKKVKIPQFGNVPCLNTVNAMNIVLWERFKIKLKI